MKKFIISILALCAIATTAAAQFPVNDNIPEKSASEKQLSTGNQVNTYEQYEFTGLLERENNLLNQRRIAFIGYLSGGAVAAIGLTLRSDYGKLSTGGTAMVTVGTLASLGAGIWLVVNEFQLISTRKKINDKLMLSVSPTGLSLHF